MKVAQKPNFMSCTAQQYVHGKVQSIEEIISPEVACTFSYYYEDSRTIPTQKISGSHVLYAYPVDVEQLVLGHTVLDILAPIHKHAHVIPQVYAVDAGHWCVKIRVEQKVVQNLPYTPLQKMPYTAVLEIMESMLEGQGLWDGTGCFHRAALFHPQQQKMHVVEDVGRHNCVDRLYGYALLHELDLEEYFLFISSRITASLYKKIRRAGIRHMVSRAAITSTTFTCATEEGCTVVAFCRPKEKRLTLFCGDGVYDA